MSWETVVWDWNGTLLNDAAACREIINRVLSRRGLPRLSLRRYQEVFDFPIRKYYSRLGFDFRTETFEEVGSEFIRLYEKRRATLRLQPGARALLLELRRRGIRQIVLSAYQHDTLASLIDQKGIASCFDRIAGADDHYAHGKKDRGLALLQEMNITCATTLMVGDTLHDHEVASAMGIACVLLDAGHQSRERLQTSGVPVLNNLAELKAWMQSSPPARSEPGLDRRLKTPLLPRENTC